MDAKKAAQVHKHQMFKDTKFGKFGIALSIGFFVFTTAYAIVYVKYSDANELTPKKSLLFDYFDPEEFRLTKARFFGVIPPPKKALKQYLEDAELFSRGQ